jgi:hypothetical protein
VAARNEDYASIIRRLQFGQKRSSVAAADAESPSPHAVDGTQKHVERLSITADESSFVDTLEETTATMQQMSRGRAEASSVAYRSAQAVVWMGDFNYRIDLDRCGSCSVRSSMICL